MVSIAGFGSATLMPKETQQPLYRWVIVIASALILAISMGGIVNGMSAFVVPMEQAYGWQRGEVALINFSGIMGLAFGSMFMGCQADKRGTRPVVLFGVTVLGLCYLASSYLTVLWQYYVVFFIAGFFGAAALFPPIMAAVGNWFATGAGLAIGIASAGQALGQGGIPFISSLMIERFGINGALSMTGGIMLVLVLPLAMLLRQPPRMSAVGPGVAQSASGEESFLPFRAVVTRMSIAILFCCTCMSVPLMHLVPLVQDRGYAPDEASSVIFIMLLVAIAGRIAFGKLADIIGALPAYMTATAWMTLMVYGFMQVGALEIFYIYAIIYGFGYAGVMTGVLVSMRMLTAPSMRASALGIVTMFGWFGHAIGGYSGGLLYDLTGDYSAAYALAAASGVVNLFVVATLLKKSRDPEELFAQA